MGPSLYGRVCADKGFFSYFHPVLEVPESPDPPGHFDSDHRFCNHDFDGQDLLQICRCLFWCSPQRGYQVDDNQELVALGCCSLIGSFFSAYPSTGSLSRSSLINNIGARTPVNTIISSLVILFTLYFLVDFIRFIPNCCLAAIVIINLFSLFKRVGRWGRRPA